MRNFLITGLLLFIALQLFSRVPIDENSTAKLNIIRDADSNVVTTKKVSPDVAGDTVKFSFGGGYFSGGMELQLSTIDPMDSIFYTLDGSDPSVKTTRYTGPIVISNNRVVRAIAVNSQKLPGIISTNTYFNQQHTLPVICLSTDPKNLWDTKTGIYIEGPDPSNANYDQDWEREANMELYDKNGKKKIDQGIGIKIAGNGNRDFPQKSLHLFARKIYGKGSFEYQFFKDKPIEKFEALLLRNGGDDWTRAMIRDILTSGLISDMDIDCQAFQLTIVYLNGEYWGIQDLREKINSHYLAENHFVNPDNVNLLELNATVVEGSNASYLQIRNFLNATSTLVNEQNYLQVSEKIDINSYIQYQLTQIYINNEDWPGSNIKFWNTIDAGSLWRWIVYDTDGSYSAWSYPAYNYNSLHAALETSGPGWPNPPWATLLFRRMMSNPGFSKEFATQYADRLNTNFSSANVNAVIDSIMQIFLPEINDHLIRWGLNNNDRLNDISLIREYVNARPDYARNHLQSLLGLGEKLNIKVETYPPEAGSVKVNSVIPKGYPFNGVYFKGLPIKLTAIPAPGYKLLRWEGTVNSTSGSIDYDMSATGTFKAVFEPAGINDFNIVINEINYNSSNAKDTKDWIELYNAGKTSVNLRNWIISDAGAAEGYIIPDDIILAPGMYVVVCRDIVAFRQVQRTVLNTTGNINFGLSSSGDAVNLFDPAGLLIDYVNFTPNLPWPTDANGTGASIELVNPLADNNDGSNWKSSSDGGTPGKINFRTIPLSTNADILASVFRLDCFPNPFSDYITVRIEVPNSGKYKLEVYNNQGKLVKMLAVRNIESGAHYIEWNGTGQNNEMLPDGVYIISLSGENQYINRKVVKLK